MPGRCAPPDVATNVKFSFRRRPTPASAAVHDGWIAVAYGPGADPVIDRLPELMTRVTREAQLPRTPSSGMPLVRSRAAAELLDTLTELRLLTLSTPDADADAGRRDTRLRAALSEAIGAAHGLALASSSQPTAGDLEDAWRGVSAILMAAGRRGLAPAVSSRGRP